MERIKGRNSSIDLFRYVCAVLVIAIHTGPFKEVNPFIGFIATDVVPRIAVPFFFIVSGYFYICKLKNGANIFSYYFKRLITIYFVWSIPYFIVEFVQWGHSNLKSYIVNCLTAFIYLGSSYHFWFFPALIFSLCLTTFLWKIGGEQIIIPLSIALYVIGVLGCAYYNVIQNIPVIGHIIIHPQFNNVRRILLMGFPFFSGGYVVLIIKKKFIKPQGVLLWLASVMIWILEIVIVVEMRYQQNIVLTFGLYPLVVSTLIVLLQNPLPNLQNIANTSRKIANFTYYTHPAFILLIYYLEGLNTSHRSGISNTALFFLTSIITFLVGLLICKLNNSSLNQIIS